MNGKCKGFFLKIFKKYSISFSARINCSVYGNIGSWPLNKKGN